MIALVALALAASAPVVRTDAGAIRGETTADGRALFRGIPFAAPPVGDRRWRAPGPAARWAGVREATRSGPACPQIDYGWNHQAALRQAEDCLYLEVGTPSLHPAAPLPVMVWIHGGGNRAGDGAGTIASPLVGQGVVLVSLQYRLSALGFLSHRALGARSGNYALMDQQAAFRWVRRNIRAFGGDPARVTIFGASAGGQDVGLQLLSPGARGLFAGAIEQSGTPTFGVAARSLAANEALGEAIVRAAGAPPHAGAAALRRLPAAALIRAAEGADAPDLDDDSFIWLQPVVDGIVLTEPPAAALAAGRVAAVPLIVGSNLRELPLFGGPAGVDRALARAFGPQAARARLLYRSGEAMARPSDTATRLAADLNFHCPALAVAEAHARVGATWQYRFAVDPAPGQPLAHGAELPFALGSAGSREELAPLFRYWANFARRGDPNGAGLPIWPGYAPGHPFVVRFTNSGPVVDQTLRQPACALLPAN